jgi:cytidine deaminase
MNEGLPEATVAMLVERAREAAGHAYAPYSGFPVGSAALTASGEVIAGANIENASIGLTNCAERVALQQAAYLGHREVVAIAVSAPRAAGTTPCGACRQVMNEFKPEKGDMYVILDYFDHQAVITLAGLLPRSFGPRDLERAT